MVTVWSSSATMRVLVMATRNTYRATQHGVVTLPPMVDVDDPGLGPGGSGGDQVWALVGEHGFEFAAHQLGQGHVRDEKSFAGRIPVAAVIGDSTAGDEAMNVRMVAPTPTIP